MDATTRAKLAKCLRMLTSVLAPSEMAKDAGISLAMWNRNWRHRLPIIHTSAPRPCSPDNPLSTELAQWIAKILRASEEAVRAKSGKPPRLPQSEPETEGTP